MKQTYDYVVVGGGSAGAAVAARLSDDGDRTVLLLEAGPADKRLEIHVPAAFSKLFRSNLDWNYDTAPQPHLGMRTIYWPRGKVLGGSSSVNAMMWIRGFREDYDSWADAAGENWSWSSLQPYFDRVERAVRSEVQRSPRSHTALFLRAAEEAGHSRLRDDQEVGVGQTRVSQRRGARLSSVGAYLTPARRRRNLTVRTGAHATRVLFTDRHASGVEYSHAGSTRQAVAAKEVILCAGAVNTPQLLMLSGIGDAQELARHGIPSVSDSPEVGKNLRDHLVAALIIDTQSDTLFAAQRLPEVGRYLTHRRGMLTSNVAEAYGFIATDPTSSPPDIELIFAPVPFVDQGLTAPTEHGLTFGAILLKPASTGKVLLSSADPFDKPTIDPRYLSDPDDVDRATLMKGLAACEDIIATQSVGNVSERRFIMPPGGEHMSRRERDEAAITMFSHTLYHPVGTARMGTDKSSVVDPALRVRGVTGLRVADTSVMPDIIRGHTNAIAMVIGEVACALILEEQ